MDAIRPPEFARTSFAGEAGRPGPRARSHVPGTARLKVICALSDVCARRFGRAVENMTDNIAGRSRTDVVSSAAQSHETPLLPEAEVRIGDAPDALTDYPQPQTDKGAFKCII